jgi:hypothetical protein
MRFAGHPAYSGLRYLIELPDGTCAELPISRAVAVPEVDPTPGSTLPVEAWAGVSELLSLAHLVQEISSTLTEEVVCHEPQEPDPFPSLPGGERVCDRREPARLGTSACRLAADLPSPPVARRRFRTVNFTVIAVSHHPSKKVHRYARDPLWKRKRSSNHRRRIHLDLSPGGAAGSARDPLPA